ncbi:MAG TPA: hypothetical protein VGO67_11560 [Verrucomicrobiae bacterium]|jgi:hypothetical protein
MSPISAISSATSQPTTALLQLLMVQYSHFANSPNWQGKADYQSLQNAIDSGNVSAALVALGRLQREGKAPSTQASGGITPAPSTNQQTISNISPAPSSNVQQSSSGGTFNATA